MSRCLILPVMIEKARMVCGADPYVTLDSGSGIVHIAPAFGEDDARVGRDNNLPFVQMVDNQGLIEKRPASLRGFL